MEGVTFELQVWLIGMGGPDGSAHKGVGIAAGVTGVEVLD
jgi:hypothetical protein